MTSTQVTEAQRICTVVLGSGRSGTSAVSKLLALLGVRANFTRDQAGESNPLGYGEDAFIIESHKRVAAATGTGSVLPAGEVALSDAEVRAAFDRLQQYLLENTTPGEPWGFKDPRTSDYLPMWRRIFNRTRITPKYVLCVRHPATVLTSFAMAYANTPEKAQLIWLNRTLNALYETGFSCFIIHYEALIAEPVVIARDLARFVFGKEGEARVDENAVRDLIRPELNRSATRPAAPAGPLAARLYAALKDLSGADFPREPLVSVVQDLIGIRNTFLPWASEGAKGRAAGRSQPGKDENDPGQDRTKRASDAAQRDAALEEARDEMESGLKELRSQFAAMAAENDHLTMLHLELRIAVEQLQSRLVTAEAKVSAVDAENGNRTELCREARSGVEQLQSRLATTETKLAAVLEAEEAKRASGGIGRRFLRIIGRGS